MNVVVVSRRDPEDSKDLPDLILLLLKIFLREDDEVGDVTIAFVEKLCDFPIHDMTHPSFVFFLCINDLQSCGKKIIEARRISRINRRTCKNKTLVLSLANGMHNAVLL